MDVTVVVATYGPGWAALAQSRAVPSALAQNVPVIHHHDPAPDATLMRVRNEALERVATEWVVYLDGDDELTPGYIDILAAATADVRAPAVTYVRGRSASPPRLPVVWAHTHTCTAECLPYGNWLVIGSAVRADMVREVGGWRDYPWSEDWDLWLRCMLAGASFEACPAAVYRAHVRSRSRNRAPTQAARLAAHRTIAAANGMPVP